MEGKEVDPTAGPIAPDFHLTPHEPAASFEATLEIRRATDMDGVAHDSDRTRQIRLEAVRDAQADEQLVQLDQSQGTTPTVLGAGDPRLRDPAPPREILLREPRSDPPVSNEPTDVLEKAGRGFGTHAAVVATAALLGIDVDSSTAYAAWI
jgi:hypothetical protein